MGLEELCNYTVLWAGVLIALVLEKYQMDGLRKWLISYNTENQICKN